MLMVSVPFSYTLPPVGMPLVPPYPAIFPVASFTNPYSFPYQFTIAGDCDDDIAFNGQIYLPDNPDWIVWPANPVGYKNGAHSYSTILTLGANETIQIGGRNNGLTGGGQGSIAYDGDTSQIWFHGFLDTADKYTDFAVVNWGAGSYSDNNFLPQSIAPAAPSSSVNGHVIFRALGNGFSQVIESTGIYASIHPVGNYFPVASIQSTYYPTSGINHDTVWGDPFLQGNGYYLTLTNQVVFPTPSEPCQKLANGLLAYWDFNGELNDATGNGNGLNSSGTIAYEQGKNGQAIRFDGSGSSVVYNDSLAISGDFTIAGWFYPINDTSNTDPAYPSIWTLNINNPANNPPDLYPSAYNGFYQGYYNPSDTGNAPQSFSLFELPMYSIQYGQWNHVVESFGNGRHRIYLNGVKTYDAPYTNAGWQGIVLGAYNHNGDNASNARIDEVGIWNRALCDQEASCLFYNGLGHFFPFPESVEISITNLSCTYSGSPCPVGVTITPDWIPYSVTYNGSTNVPVNSGTYAVNVQSTDTCFPASASATLVINKAPATISVSNLNNEGTGSPICANVTTNPAGLSYVVTYDGSTNCPSATGSYSLVATITDPNHVGQTSADFKIICYPTQITINATDHYFSGCQYAATASSDQPNAQIQITYTSLTKNNAETTTAPTLIDRYRVVATALNPYCGTAVAWMSIFPASSRGSVLKIADGQWRYCNYGLVFTAGTADDLYQQVYEYRLAHGLNVCTTVSDVDAFVATLEGQLQGKGYLQSLPDCCHDC